jgi:hypothetical protein
MMAAAVGWGGGRNLVGVGWGVLRTLAFAIAACGKAHLFWLPTFIDS